MDTFCRGVVSELIEHVFETQKILKTIDWIVQSDYETISKEDLALGYFMGSLMNISANVVLTLTLQRILDEGYRQKLRQIYGEKEGEHEFVKYKMRIETSKAKNHSSIDLNDVDKEQLRAMLIPMITLFREKVRQEMVLDNI